MKALAIPVVTAHLAIALLCSSASAQDTAPATRAAIIEQEQQAKEAALRPYTPTKGEHLAIKVQELFVDGGLHWHPFFEPASPGAGLTLGAGYMHHVSAYNLVDLRASYSLDQSKRAELEFTAPRLFTRRGTLSVLGGWREATEVGFYGLGTDSREEDESTYGFRRPYAQAALTVEPFRKVLALKGAVGWSRWDARAGRGPKPSIETRYTPDVLPGVNATVDYLHSQAGLALDFRTSPGYSRRGGYVGVTAHDYTDRETRFGFVQMDYAATQHIPILREAWVISLHGEATTTYRKTGQQIPFFMLPSLGGGSTLRGYGSLRFRDRHSLLLQGEWRIMANRYLDTAVFYDTGKVMHTTDQFDLKGLKHDYGFGFRFHGPFATPLRLDLARSREGLAVVFATSAIF